MFISDHLRVALISETLEATSPLRRRAAKMLLDTIHSGQLPQPAEENLNAIDERAGHAVGAEARLILVKLGVCSSAEQEMRSAARG